MDTADAIRTSRIRAGKTAQQVAAELGLNDAWYQDLESDDDELANTLSLFQAMHLAAILNVRLSDFFQLESPNRAIAIMDLPALIHAHLKKTGLSIDSLEEKLGWELRELMEAPVQTAATLSVAFFQDLSTELGINWLALIPEP